jgi:tetratricopeptide (TPR) repeat protein
VKRKNRSQSNPNRPVFSKSDTDDTAVSVRQPTGFQISPLTLCVLLFLLAVCTFLPTLKNGFINFDDPLFVTENYHVNGGLSWAGLKWAFYGTDGGLWLPLTWISHMVDCQLYGLKPWGHHLTSVLIHAVTTVLVFVWLFRMTGAKWRSFVVGALFGMHPLRVESVAWAAERKDVLSVLFWFLTLLAYTEYAKRRTEPSIAKRFYALTLLCFVLGLMSKPMLVTLPFVLLLLDWWPLNRLQDRKDIKQLLFEKWPFFVLSVLASIVTFAVQKTVAVLNQEPLVERIENTIISYVQYIGKIFWPENLCVYYPYLEHFLLGGVFAAAILLIIISLFFVWQWRRHPCLLVGWLWFLGTLMPVIGLVQSGKQAMADRYTYIPQVGLLLCLTWGAHALTKTWKRQSLILSATATAAIIACMMLTCRQIGYWKDSETLFARAIAVTKNNFIAHTQRGIALLQKGRVNEAMDDFRKSLEIKPDDDVVYDDLGLAFCQLGRTNEAINCYKEAVEINLYDASGYNNIGSALYQMGRTTEAIGYFKKSLEIKPYNDAACYNLGVALFQLGRTTEAIDYYNKALAINRNDAEAYGSLGLVLFHSGQTDEAIADYQKALAINPNDAKTCNNLGFALSQMGRLSEAIDYYQKSLLAETNDASVYDNLGFALFQLGRTADAIVSYKKGLMRNPNDAETYSNLGTALCQMGRMDEAVNYFQKSLEIEPTNAAVCGNLGLALYQLGRTTEAIGYYKKALAINLDDAGTQFNFGNALFQQGQIGEAIVHYQKALENNPNHTGAYCNLGYALYKTGRVNEAIVAAQRALQLANEQNNPALASTIEKQIKFYQASFTLHDNSSTNVPAQPLNP